MSKKTGKIQMNVNEGLGQNPFDSMKLEGLPVGEREQKSDRQADLPGKKKATGLKRLDIQREKAGRGGKTVTVITGMERFASPVEREAWALRLRKGCSTGGTLKEGRIELQGDQREKAFSLLKEAGFHPVYTGG